MSVCTRITWAVGHRVLPGSEDELGSWAGLLDVIEDADALLTEPTVIHNDQIRQQTLRVVKEAVSRAKEGNSLHFRKISKQVPDHARQVGRLNRNQNPDVIHRL